MSLNPEIKYFLLENIYRLIPAYLLIIDMLDADLHSKLYNYSSCSTSTSTLFQRLQKNAYAISTAPFGGRWKKSFYSLQFTVL